MTLFYSVTQSLIMVLSSAALVAIEKSVERHVEPFGVREGVCDWLQWQKNSGRRGFGDAANGFCSVCYGFTFC